MKGAYIKAAIRVYEECGGIDDLEELKVELVEIKKRNDENMKWYADIKKHNREHLKEAKQIIKDRRKRDEVAYKEAIEGR